LHFCRVGSGFPAGTAIRGAEAPAGPCGPAGELHRNGAVCRAAAGDLREVLSRQER